MREIEKPRKFLNIDRFHLISDAICSNFSPRKLQLGFYFASLFNHFFPSSLRVFPSKILRLRIKSALDIFFYVEVRRDYFSLSLSSSTHYFFFCVNTISSFNGEDCVVSWEKNDWMWSEKISYFLNIRGFFFCWWNNVTWCGSINLHI